MNPVLALLASKFLSKKRIIGWGAAIAFAVGGAAAGMQTQEFKDAVCGAAVIEQESK